MSRIALYSYGKVIGYTTVDPVDRERFKDFTWHRSSAGYVARMRPRADGPERRMILLHREILGLEYGDQTIVDHINRNKLDNRRSNIRVTTRVINQLNRGRGKNNTSGCPGVIAPGGAKKSWSIYFGGFESREKAAQAVRAARKFLPKELGY